VGSVPSQASLFNSLSYSHLCAFVTKQYSLVLVKGGDARGWEDNQGPGEK